MEVSSVFVTRVFGTLSIPRWSAGEGASISIKAVELTGKKLALFPSSSLLALI
jgi:hypothetical protein